VINAGHYHNTEGIPEICGAFTNWKPVKMIELGDFISKRMIYE
jgi:hypothetical protein